jgi:hypothetical protein
MVGKIVTAVNSLAGVAAHNVHAAYSSKSDNTSNREIGYAS